MHICKKNIFSFLILSLFILLICGCSEKKEIILPVNFTVISGEPIYSVKDSSVICDLSSADELSAEYHLKKDPLTYYFIGTEIKGNAEVIINGSKNDINGESILSSADENGIVNRFIRSSIDGSLEFSIKVKGSGKAEIIGTYAIPAENNGCRIYKSESGNVSILLDNNDVLKSGITEDQLVRWLNSLDIIRNTVSEWSADGLGSLDICAVNKFDHYGLSGDPVYICESYMSDELKKVSDTSDLSDEQKDILWGIVHEICHASDGFGHGEVSSRIFDSEFSAQLECACALEANGYRYNGKNTAKEFYSGKNTLEKHLYSDEAFIYRLLEIFEEHNTGLSEIIPVFSMECPSEYDTDEKKLGLFFDNLEKTLGYSVKDCFTDNETETLMAKFSS